MRGIIPVTLTSILCTRCRNSALSPIFPRLNCVVVKRLRRKLGGDADSPKYIFTEPRVDYRMPRGRRLANNEASVLLKVYIEVRLGITRLLYVRLRPRSGVTIGNLFPVGNV